MLVDSNPLSQHMLITKQGCKKDVTMDETTGNGGFLRFGMLTTLLVRNDAGWQSQTVRVRTLRCTFAIALTPTPLYFSGDCIVTNLRRSERYVQCHENN